MKKSRKLLSVLLAMIMILSSMTMIASAAPANYKTVDDLNGMGAYSKYGAATRLSTEERTSMVLDALDNILEAANINLGTVFNALGLSLTIDLRSINALCETVDQVKSLKGSTAVKLFGGLLGIVKDLNTDSWEVDVDRTNDDQIRILYELTQLLYENRQLISNVIESGELDVGVIGNFVDLSAVSGYLSDIPGLIKGLIIPLLIRADDTAATLSDYKNKASGAGKLEDILDNFVQGIFSKPMNWTSYRENAAGKPCDEDGNTAHGATVALPTEPEATANYYVKGTNANGDAIITRYKYNLEFGSWAEDGTFIKTEEKEGSGVYIYADPNGGENLKYYTYGEDGYFLPNAKTLSFSIKGNDSAASLLYKFASPVFSAMAPVVLNGSLKKILGQWFGAEYTYVGQVGSAEVQALPDSSDVFFTQEQGQYLWEWSDYKVINGNHYYRFEDQIYSSDLSNCNPYFEIINWDYNIPGNFLDEFIPSINGTTVTNSKAGYSTILQGLNKFLIKVANTVLNKEVINVTLADGDNSNLVANVKTLAQTIVKHSPESIFGADYATGYYDLMTNAASSNQDVLNGIAATIIGLVMPQMIVPSAENLKGNSVGAILAAVLRELATQLLPNHNYDALIYNDYNHKTFVAGKDNSYWLDVILTIGTDIGVHYLMNLADMGEGTAQWAGMTKAGWADSKTYTAADLNEISGVKPWEAKVDYVVDWALDNSYEWCWGMENLVDVEGLTIDPATVQDPWVKLDKIFNDLLPLKQIINCTPASGMTWLETVLRQNVILAIADLRIKDLTDLLIVPNGALRNTDVLLQIATIVKNLLNTLLQKVGSYTLLDSVSKVNRIDDLLNQTNLATVVRNLLGMIWPAINKDYSIANGAKAGTAGTFARDGLLTTALPIVNMFLGWTTDAQKMQNPTLLFSNAEGLPYMYTTGTTVSSTLKIRNDSAGMLLKHRTSSVTDKAYNIVVQKVECSDSSFSTTATLPMTIAPYTKGEIPITLNYAGDESISIKITYVFMGKDGKQVGQTQTATAYQYVSNQKTDAGGSTGDKSDAVKGGVANSKNALGVDVTGTTAVLVADSFSGAISYVNNYTVNFRNTTESPYVIWVKQASGRGQPEWVTFNNDFSHGTSKPSVAGEGYITKDPETGTIKPFLVDESKIPESMKTGPQAIDLGQWTVTWHNNLKAPLIGNWNENTGNNNLDFTLDAGDIYVTDTVLLKETYNNYKDLNRIGFPGVSDATWSAFQKAILDAAAIVERPFKIADVTGGVYARDKQDALIKALNDTYDAVVKGATGVENPTATMEAALAAAEPGGDVPEINYQDYVLYEYFEYQDLRTETRNRIKAYQAPQAPAEKRIDGSALTADQINALVAAETNAQKKLAIDATVLTPTDAERDAYKAALAAWQMPGYTRLDNNDVASRLTYYRQFIEKVTTQNQFLDKEIKAADAQAYDEATYSKASWADYKAAYDNAVAVRAKGTAALQSEVFNAKYELMRTQNELVLATRSAKETGAYATLEELAAKAETIFARPEYYAPVEGMTEADAYAALIKALGYKYTDDAGNEAILYSRSAYDYMAYDRETTSNNMAKIAAAETALKTAIDNFVCTIQLEAKPGDTTTVVAQGPRIIDGIEPGSIASVDDLLTHLQATVPEATLETTVSKANTFGTGAKVDVKLDGTTMTTYYVVIYGDVNGDGAIDGFDAIELDLANNGSAALDGAYATAADTDGDGVINSVDYASVIAEVQCTSSIAQTK